MYKRNHIDVEIERELSQCNGKCELIGSLIGGALGLIGSSGQSDAASSAASSSAAASKYATDLQKYMYDQSRQDQMPWLSTGSNALSMLSGLMGLPNQYAQYYGMSDQQLRDALLSQYTGQGKTTTNGTTNNQYSGTPLQGWGNNPILNKTKGLNNVSGSNTGTSSNTIDETGLAAQIAKIKAGLSGYDPNSPNNGSLMRNFGLSDFQTDPGYQWRMDQGMNQLQGRAAAGGGLRSGNTLKALMDYGQGQASQEYGNAYNRFNTNQTNQYNRLSNLAGLGQTASNALSNTGANYANNAGSLALNNSAIQGNALMTGANARSSAYNGIGNSLSNINFGNLFGNSSSGSNYGSGILGDVLAFGSQ